MSKIIVNPEGLQLTSPYYSIDLETTGLNPKVDKVLAIAISNGVNEIVFDTNTCDKQVVIDMIRATPTDTVWIAHNMKFDIKFLYSYCGEWLPTIWDTYTVSQLLDNGNSRDRGYHSLLECLNRYVGIKEIDAQKKDIMREKYLAHKVGNPLSEDMIEYAAHDVRHLLALYTSQRSSVSSRGIDKWVALDNTVLPAVARMEYHGALVDVDTLSKYSDGWEDKFRELTKTLDKLLYKAAKKLPPNPDKRSVYNDLLRKLKKQRMFHSVKQVGLFGGETIVEAKSSAYVNHSSEDAIIHIIHDIFNITPPTVKVKLTDKYRYSVSEEAIDNYLNTNTKSPLLDYFTTLLAYRKVEKLVSTYGRSLIGKCIDSRLHTDYTLAHARNLRMSSRNPNLQNIPGGLHHCFIAPKDYVLITSDQSNAEGRIAADKSGEPMLMDAYNNDLDVHSYLASKTYSLIFGEPIDINNTDEEITFKGHTFVKEKLRKDHKPVLFGKFYKAGAAKIYNILAPYINLVRDKKKQRVELAKQISDGIDDALPVLTKYLSHQITLANQRGELRGALNSFRYFTYKKAYADAANFEMSNTNAAAIKTAIIRIDRLLADKDAQLVIVVHDEVVVECHKDIADVVAKEVHTIMTESLAWFLKDVKADSSVKTKLYWEK